MLFYLKVCCCMFCMSAGIENRLRELCTDLLGPVCDTGGHNSWQANIMVRTYTILIGLHSSFNISKVKPGLKYHK